MSVAAVAYFLLTPTDDSSSGARVVDAIANSVTAFHGRGIGGNLGPGDPRSLVAAAEAVLVACQS
jgi:hypothetical protein